MVPCVSCGKETSNRYRGEPWHLLCRRAER